MKAINKQASSLLSLIYSTEDKREKEKHEHKMFYCLSNIISTPQVM